MMIAVKAVEKAGADREKVRAAIESMQFVGTAGVFNFTPTDHNGLGLDAFEMITVRGGKFVPAAK
jgi:branched-chain amino acid transport system substrate-binding protein